MPSPFTGPEPGMWHQQENLNQAIIGTFLNSTLTLGQDKTGQRTAALVEVGQETQSLVCLGLPQPTSPALEATLMGVE